SCLVRLSQEITGMTTRRDLVAFVAANLVAFAVALVAVNQAWIADLDDVPRALIGRWLPYALALCVGLAIVIAVHLDARSAFLVRHFALYLANDYAGTRYFVFYPTKLPDIHGIHVGDAIYSVRDLGLPFLSVIPFATAGRTGVMAMLCLVGALLAAQLYLLLRDLRFDR